MEINENNYYTPEANQSYWSVSQFKSFMRCPNSAMAEIDGIYQRPETDSLLLGNFVDSALTASKNEFIAEHPEILNSRSGQLKAAFRTAEDAISHATRDTMFMEYMDGDKQRIFTGELFGEMWKVKPDVLHSDRIVDLKYMRDTKSLFMDGERKTFIDAWGYDLQGFVYQAIVEQATGKHLPFYLAVITKETPADIEIIHIPDWKLNSSGELIKHYLPEFVKVKKGEAVAQKCGHCEWCRQTKIIKRVTEYEELLERI